MHEALSLSKLKNRQNSIKYYNKTSEKRLYGLLSFKLQTFKLQAADIYASSSASSESQTSAQASLAIRKSPLGERATLPTLGPSGKQERLN